MRTRRDKSDKDSWPQQLGEWTRHLLRRGSLGWRAQRGMANCVSIWDLPVRYPRGDIGCGVRYLDLELMVVVWTRGILGSFQHVCRCYWGYGTSWGERQHCSKLSWRMFLPGLAPGLEKLWEGPALAWSLWCFSIPSFPESFELWKLLGEFDPHLKSLLNSITFWLEAKVERWMMTLQTSNTLMPWLATPLEN